MSERKRPSLFVLIKDYVSKHKVKSALAILVILVVSGIAVYIKVKSRNYSMNVSLVYQDASNGKNPNGTRYDPYLILSDEVLDPVEKELGFEVDDKVWIRPAGNTKGESIATEYTLYCKDTDSCPVVLIKIAENYTKYFETHYTMNDSILKYESPDKKLDYIEITDYLEKETNKITTFISKQLKKDDSWYADDGSNYQDLLEYGENILKIDIANLRAYITETGITENPETIRQSFEYRNLLLDIDRKNLKSQYENRKTAIELYDPTLFPTISVPSVTTGEYYVTTTKTGLDYIYDAASVFSEEAYKLQKTISKNELVVRNMKEINYGTKTEQKIQEIERKINYLIEQTKALDEKYKKNKRTQYLVFGEIKN